MPGLPFSAPGNAGAVADLIKSSFWTGARFNIEGGVSMRAIAVRDGGDADARAMLDAARGVYATQIRDLRVVLTANPILVAWLHGKGIELSSVIAANIAADGSLCVYTD
jgi:hypothetical protein